jgi:hypothetical protein
MKTLFSYHNLPALVAHVIADTASSIHSSWAVAMSTFADGLFPLSVFGEHPCLEACVRDIGNVIWRERQSCNLACMDLLEFSDVRRPAGAPRIVCPLTVGPTTCLLAFGPRRDGGEYSASDVALLKGLTGQLSEFRDEIPAESRLVPVEGFDYFGVQHNFLETGGPEGGGGFLDLMSFDAASLFVSMAGLAEPEPFSEIIMAGIQASLHSLARSSEGEVSKLVCELNHIVRELAPRSFLASIFVGQFDSARQHLRYVNAGYQAPLLIRANRIRAVRLESTAAMLGLTDSAPCWHRTIPMQPRDVFLALPEDCPVTGERAGLEVVLKHREASSGELAAMIGMRLKGLGEDRPVVVVRATERPIEMQPFGAMEMAA